MKTNWNNRFLTYFLAQEKIHLDNNFVNSYFFLHNTPFAPYLLILSKNELWQIFDILLNVVKICISFDAL